MKQRYFWQLLLFLFFVSDAFSQQWNWVQTIRPGGNEYCWDVALDPQGNVLSTGRVKATSTFGWGSNLQTPPWKSSTETDAFLAKYRANGELVWAKRDGGKFADWGRAVCTDKNSNVYVTGDFCDTASFGNITIIGVGTNQNRNIFVAKYDSSGTCLWAKGAGSTGVNNSRGYSIIADTAGNSYVTGHVSGPSNFDGVTFGTSGKNVPFIAKFNSSGTCQWVKTINVQYNGEGNEIRIDRQGDLVVTGNYKGNLYIGSTTFPGNSPSWGDVFLMKLDVNGNFKWTKTAVGAYQDLPYALATDSVDNIYVTGTFANNLTFGTTTINSIGWGNDAASANAGIDIFLAKYDRNGNFKWVKTIGNPGVVSVDDIEITPAHRVLITGSLSGAVDMSGTSISLGGNPHSFVTAYDTLGNMRWYKLNGGGTTSSIARGLAVDPTGNIYVGGEYTGAPAMDFDTITVTSGNGYDGYIAKLWPAVDPDVFTSASTFCDAGNVTLNAVQDGSPVSYQWILPGASPNTSSSNTPTVNYAVPGSYDVTLITSNSYTSDTLILEDYISVSASPTVYLGPDSIACNAQTVILYADTGHTYLWNDGSTASSLAVNTAGNYFVTVTNSAGCSASDTIAIAYDICISTEESILSSFALWPNPAAGQISLTIGDLGSSKATFSLFNMVGEKVQGIDLNGSTTETVNLNGLAAGIYLYHVDVAGARKTGKLFVE